MTSFLVQKQPVYAATNSDNKASVLSSPGPFIKSSPANAATIQPTNPTLSWGASSGATSYQYCINTTASCTAPAAWISTGTSTSVALSGLIHGTKYYWQVRARNNTGITYANGGSTVWWSYTIAPAPTPTRTKVPPSPTPTNTSVPPTPTPTATSTPPTPMFTPTTYYVSPTGNDSNPGTSPESAWKTLAQVNAFAFQPGDTILFERNGVWTGSGLANSTALVINRSGTAGAPITFGAYGDGSLPVLMNPPFDSNGTRGVVIHASWVVFENFMVKDTHAAGIYTDTSSHNNIFRNLEITNTGFGIMLSGTNHLATHNYIHDLHMINNTQGGNDDYGAVGIELNYVSNSETSYNRMVGCQAPSFDYGMDGGAVEWWGNSDNNYVHHNWGENDNGFAEIGGHAGEHAYDNVIAYNVSYNNGEFTVLHIGGTFGIDASFRVENNTIIETQPHSPLQEAMIGFVGSPNANTYILRNNLFYLNDVQFLAPADSRGWVFTHDHNLYQFLNYKTILGFSLGEGEQITSLNLSAPANGDFHLLSSSPAINVGLPLGYPLDFDGHPVPTDQNPDIGAFQYQNH